MNQLHFTDKDWTTRTSTLLTAERVDQQSQLAIE